LPYRTTHVRISKVFPGAMLLVKLLPAIWLERLQAAVSVEADWCGDSLVLDDAVGLYQQRLRVQQTRGAGGGPKIDLKNLDLSDLGSLIPRQLTPAEIDAQVVTLHNLTDSVKSMRKLAEQATSPLVGDQVPGELNQMTRKLVAAFTSIETMSDHHLQALTLAFDKIKQNSPPLMALATAKGEIGLKGPVQELVQVAGSAKAKLHGNISSPSDLCNQASTFLSDFRRHTKKYAKACDVILYMLPPRLPPDNPYVNSTLVEATRSMYTLVKAALQDADDSIEIGMATFLRNGAGCELDIVDTADVEEEKPSQQQPQQSAAFALRWPAIAVAVLLVVGAEKSFI